MFLVLFGVGLRLCRRFPATSAYVLESPRGIMVRGKTRKQTRKQRKVNDSNNDRFSRAPFMRNMLNCAEQVQIQKNTKHMHIRHIVFTLATNPVEFCHVTLLSDSVYSLASVSAPGLRLRSVYLLTRL